MNFSEWFSNMRYIIDALIGFSIGNLLLFACCMGKYLSSKTGE